MIPDARSAGLTAADLFVDLSKNLITDEIRASLVELGREVGLEARRDAMFARASGSTSRRRTARCCAHRTLRRPRTDSLVVDGTDVVAQVHEVLDQVYAFADKVRTSGAASPARRSRPW